MLDSQSFAVGFLAGIFAMFILGNLASRIQKNRKVTQTPARKVAVPVKGEDSPREIMGRAASAGARMTGWTVLFILGLVGVLYFVYWAFTY